VAQQLELEGMEQAFLEQFILLVVEEVITMVALEAQEDLEILVEAAHQMTETLEEHLISMAEVEAEQITPLEALAVKVLLFSDIKYSVMLKCLNLKQQKIYLKLLGKMSSTMKIGWTQTL
jgi:hypothetical protein